MISPKSIICIVHVDSVFRTDMIKSIFLFWNVQFLNILVIIKTKILMYMEIYSILAILFRNFDLLTPKYFKIIWLSNILIFNVPDEGYSRNA